MSTTVILELFSCSGGLAAGFHRAGLRVDTAFDHDADACASYEQNIGVRPICMDVKDLLQMVRSGWRPAERIDLIVSDPPCTPWSRAGKRQGLEDERDMLRESVELIDLLEPRAWLIGNLPGLDEEPNAPAVRATIGLLVPHYHIDYARLEAAHYGVPQFRARPFWFGHAPPLACIAWPAATHGDVSSGLLPGFALKPFVTCREALAHLPPNEIGRPQRQPHNPKHPPSEADAPARTVTSNGSRYQTNAIEWPWDRPSTSITCDSRLQPPGHNDSVYKARSAPNAIALSERAAAILQGFPDGWVFSGETRKARWQQIGQAVPPPLAEAIARSIRRVLRTDSQEVAHVSEPLDTQANRRSAV